MPNLRSMPTRRTIRNRNLLSTRLSTMTGSGRTPVAVVVSGIIRSCRASPSIRIPRTACDRSISWSTWGGGGIRLYMQNCRTSGGAKDCSGPASLVGWNGHLLCEERVSGELGVGGRFWILPACNNNPAVPEGWRLPDRSSCRGITWRVLGSQGAPRRPPSYINGWG